MLIATITAAFVLVTVGYLFFVAALSRRPAPGRTDLDPSLYYVFLVPALDEERVIANTLDSLAVLPADRTFTFVVDADGRLEPDVLDHVDPILRTKGVGAVQLMVRIFNRGHLLTRFQDFEFVSFSALLQRARQHIGSVGLGGNGQFVRLSALQSLGDAPWTDCLTEDLDLGIRLSMAGWDNRFTGASVVSQQGVTDIRVLWRQRTRWIHGHLQCWKLVPEIIRSDLPTRTVADLLYYLAAPLVLALASILFTFPLIVLVCNLVGGFSIGPVGWRVAVGLIVWYLVAFAPAILLGAAYNRTARDVSLARSMVLSHLLLIYNYIWYAAVWRAIGRIIFHRGGWTKTTRLDETPGAMSTQTRLVGAPGRA